VPFIFNGPYLALEDENKSLLQNFGTTHSTQRTSQKTRILYYVALISSKLAH
jgi:hypothetical protein